MKAEFFDTFSEAFALCRDRDRPLIAVVVEKCDECCAETVNGSGHKRAHKIYPSGRAVPTNHAAEDYVT